MLDRLLLTAADGTTAGEHSIGLVARGDSALLTLRACGVAAGAGGPVAMHHVVDAIRVECAKLDLPVGLSLNGANR